jgi:hypothetical protein
MAQRINKFIASTHPNAPLAGQGAMLVRAADRWGVDPRVLAIIARKESEFGSTSGRFKNNAWGWGVHLGADVNTAPSWEVMAERVAKGLSGSLYKGAGKVTLSDIMMRYAPPSENDTRLYIQQISDWYRSMGGNPNANIFKTDAWRGARSVAAGAQNVADVLGPPQDPSVPMADTGDIPPPANAATFDPILITPGRVVINPGSMKAIEAWRENTLKQVMEGRGEITDVNTILPGIKFDLTAPVWQGGSLTNTGGSSAVAPRAGGRTATDTATDTAPAPSPARNLSPGGGWGGTYKPASALRDIAKKHGLVVTSEKRNTQSTASGGTSDHWSGNRSAYAYDLGWSSSTPVPAADRAASEIVRSLGGPANWGTKGGVFNTTLNGIRYQVLYRTNVGGNHFNHIHVGARRV